MEYSATTIGAVHTRQIVRLVVGIARPGDPWYIGRGRDGLRVRPRADDAGTDSAKEVAGRIRDLRQTYYPAFRAGRLDATVEDGPALDDRREALRGALTDWLRADTAPGETTVKVVWERCSGHRFGVRIHPDGRVGIFADGSRGSVAHEVGALLGILVGCPDSVNGWVDHPPEGLTQEQVDERFGEPLYDTTTPHWAPWETLQSRTGVRIGKDLPDAARREIRAIVAKGMTADEEREAIEAVLDDLPEQPDPKGAYSAADAAREAVDFHSP